MNRIGNLLFAGTYVIIISTLGHTYPLAVVLFTAVKDAVTGGVVVHPVGALEGHCVVGVGLDVVAGSPVQEVVLHGHVQGGQVLELHLNGNLNARGSRENKARIRGG